MNWEEEKGKEKIVIREIWNEGRRKGCKRGR